jgi:hypothetical protein
MRTLAAYVLTFFLAPTFSALVGLAGVSLPINFVTALIQQALVGVAAVWIGRMIFSWFGLTAGWPTAIMLLIAFVWNDLSHPVAGDNFGTVVGSVVGIVGGATWLL